MVTIRKAGKGEGTLIAKLSRQTFMEAFSSVNTPEDMALFMSTQFTVEALEAETQLPGLLFFIAWEDDQPVGYLKLKEHGNGYPAIKPKQPTLEICRIYILQSHAGRGIGQELMDLANEVAKDNAYPVIFLGVWENNGSAIRFYQRNGFEKVGSHSFLLGTDHQTDWLMAKKT